MQRARAAAWCTGLWPASQAVSSTALEISQSESGSPLHPTLAEMAAAYLFHIGQNHPFLDGNKRAALATALVFLWLNGQQLDAGEDGLTELVMGVAAGQIGKAELGVFIDDPLRPAD